MKEPYTRFAIRIYSRFPVQISMMYLGQDCAGQGIVRELSRVGCRILGIDPMVAGKTMSVRISLPSCELPLVMQATVKWVKGLQFGMAFEQPDEWEIAQLQRRQDERVGSGSYSGRPIPYGTTSSAMNTLI